MLVTQSCPTLCDPMDSSWQGSSVHRILQARVLEWFSISFSRGSSQPRDWTQVFHMAGRSFTVWDTTDALSSVQFSRSVVSDSLRPHELQHASLPVHHQHLESTQTHVHWVSDAIQPSYPLSTPSPPALNLSQHRGLFKWVSSSTSGGQSIGVLASASDLSMNTQDWSPLGWTGWICSSPRDSQESSPTTQFKSINSSVLSFLNSLTFTSIHDHWKNHSLD